MSTSFEIEDIKASKERIKSLIKRTPLDKSYKISDMLNCNLYLKMEMLQRCKAFKFLGAINKISKLIT